jgi:hypothetical protein
MWQTGPSMEGERGKDLQTPFLIVGPVFHVESVMCLLLDRHCLFLVYSVVLKQKMLIIYTYCEAKVGVKSNIPCEYHFDVHIPSLLKLCGNSGVSEITHCNQTRYIGVELS